MSSRSCLRPSLVNTSCRALYPRLPVRLATPRRSVEHPDSWQGQLSLSIRKRSSSSSSQSRKGCALDRPEELHDTPRFGNEILRRLFEKAGDASARRSIPPILAVANTGTYRDVTFLGLLVPGLAAHSATDDLAAIWRTTDGRRFALLAAHPAGRLNILGSSLRLPYD
jgi:Restriction endonuclease AspBHI N-terminal